MYLYISATKQFLKKELFYLKSQFFMFTVYERSILFEYLLRSIC
jgi:hypothetical protein